MFKFSGASKFHKVGKKNVTVPGETSNSDLPVLVTNHRLVESSAKSLSKPTNRQGLASSRFRMSSQQGSVRNDKITLKEKILFSSSSNNGNKGSIHPGLPKPPGPE